MPLRTKSSTATSDAVADPSPTGERRAPAPVDALGRPPEPPTISPRMTAVFGGLFGLATVASIVALLIQVFPVQDQRSLAAQAPAEASSEDLPPPPDAEKPKKLRERKLLPMPWRVTKLKGKYKLVEGVTERRSFIIALNEAGVPKKQVYRVLTAFEGVRKYDRTGRADKFIVALDGNKEIQAFEYIVSDTEIYQARTNDEGLLVGERLDMKVATERYAASFYIGDDFEKSFRSAGFEPGLTREINRAFNGRTSTEAFEKGGVVRAVVVEKTSLGRFASYDHIDAIEYRPPEGSDGKVRRAYWFETGGYRGYVDEKGRRPSKKGWRSPVPGAPVTSHFNPKRMHPVLNRVMPHNGTDFGAPSGTPVYAAKRGTVVLAGMHGASGNLVLIDHPGGIQTGYAHLSRFAKGLNKGDKVGTRQLIGYVGSTGRSTGPHLHFSAKRNGKFFNALDLKLDAIHLLPVGDRAAFLQLKRSLDEEIDKLPIPEAPPPPPPEPEPEPEASAADDAGEADEVEKPAPEGESDADADWDGDEDLGSSNEGDDEKSDAPSGSSGDDDRDGGGEGADLLGADLTEIE